MRLRLRTQNKPEINRKVFMRSLLNCQLKDLVELEDTNYSENEADRDNTFILAINHYKNYRFIINQDIIEEFKHWLKCKILFWRQNYTFIKILEVRNGNLLTSLFYVSFYEYWKLYFRCKRLFKEKYLKDSEHCLNALVRNYEKSVK